MSTAGSEPTQARRRLALPWRRDRTPAARSGRRSRRPVAYAPEALPERQPSLAALVPVTLGRFSATAATLIVLFAVMIATGLFESLTGRPLITTAQPRFATTLAGLRQCVDVRESGSLWNWLGQLSVLAAAGGALVIRQLRRHRLDDRRGRHAAWGSLATIFLVTACAGAVPLGKLYAGLLTDLTGMALGPSGYGWWILTAGLAYAVVGLWAVLPLYERAGTAVWLGLCFAAWAMAGGCGWVEDRIPHQAAVGQAAWLAGGGLAAVAMLTAARSVVREVRGLAGTATDGAGSRRARTTRQEPAPAVRLHGGAPQVSAAGDGERSAGALAPEASGPTDYIDGDSGEEGFETDGRPLSKAERKRLRKLARMSRAA